MVGTSSESGHFDVDPRTTTVDVDPRTTTAAAAGGT
jgi:hypothetical protein